ncbi:hypothetical protein ALC56_06356, partial [Trachymyrmex septentrionalis]
SFAEGCHCKIRLSSARAGQGKHRARLKEQSEASASDTVGGDSITKPIILMPMRKF